MENKDKAQGIESYIAQFPRNIQIKLNAIRACIHTAAPQATELIAYNMPTFKYHGNLVHFAAYPHHIGFYPTPSALIAFNSEVCAYKNGKGSIQFPHDKALPLALISKIVTFRVNENISKTQLKTKKTKK